METLGTEIALAYESKPPEFTKFLNLPAEIRQQIWTCLLPGARVAHIMGDFAGGCFAETTSNPSLLHICHESRALFLKHYRCTFEPHLLRPVYFNPSQDILLMQNDKVLDRFFSGNKGAITSEVTLVEVIAVDTSRPRRNVPFPQDMISRFLSVMGVAISLINAAARFGNLREIILLIDGSQDELDVQSIISSSDVQGRLGRLYSELRDQYAERRREFVKDCHGKIPDITLTTVVDFWNRFP